LPTVGLEVVERRTKTDESGDGRPPGHQRLFSPYDTDARWSVKRDAPYWQGSDPGAARRPLVGALLPGAG
jgi:hypothetical protein